MYSQFMMQGQKNIKFHSGVQPESWSTSNEMREIFFCFSVIPQQPCSVRTREH